MNFLQKDHRTGTFHRQEPNGRTVDLRRELSFKGYLDPEGNYSPSPKKGRLRDEKSGGMALVLGSNRPSTIVITHKTNWRLVVSLTLMIIICYIMTGGSVPWQDSVGGWFLSKDPEHLNSMLAVDGGISQKLPGECALNNICRDVCGDVMCFRHKIHCGGCDFPQWCGGGGEENQCGCKPVTCATLGRKCGVAPDGCGGTLHCGAACVQPTTSLARFGPRLRPGQMVGASKAGDLYRVGYYLNWAQFRQGPSKIEPEELPSHLYSHLYYAFARIDEDTLEIKQSVYNEMDPPPGEKRYKAGMWRRFVKVARAGGAVPLLNIGGYEFISNQGGHKIVSSLVQSPQKRAKFVENVARWLEAYDYLGIGWSWDNPSAEDGVGLLALLKELRAKFDELEKKNGVRYWLTVSVQGDRDQADRSFPDKDALAAVVDWVGVMAYHMYSYQPWLDAKVQPVGSQAPLFNFPGLGSVHLAVAHWEEAGFPMEKLLLGVSAAGLLWRLKDETKFGYGAAAVAPGEGPDGSVLMTTAELRAFFTGEGAELDLFHKPTVSAYGHKSLDWVSYESIESLALKVEYIVQHRLLGYAFWSVDMDYENFTLSHAIAGKTGAVYPSVERLDVASQ